MFIDNFNWICRQNGVEPWKFTVSELGLSHGTYTKWKSGSEPRANTLKRIADYFGVTITWLVSEHDFGGDKVNWRGASPAEPPAEETRLPIYGEISAGRGVLAEQDIIGWEYTDKAYHDGEHFWLSVKGISMEPELRNKDIVLIRRQPTLENGEIGAFIYGGEGFVKKYVTNNDIRLHSINPNFPDIIITPETADQFSIIGRVVESRHKY